MYYLALILGVAYTISSTHHLSLSALVLHLGALQSWTTNMDIATSFNGPAWTLSVEMFFYFMFPFLIEIVHKIQNGRGKGLLILFIGAFTGAVPTVIHAYLYGPLSPGLTNLPNSFVWSYVMPIRYLGLFISGIGAAYLTLSLKDSNHSSRIDRYLLRPNLLVVLVLSILVIFNLNSPNNALVSLFANFWLGAVPIGLTLSSIHLRPSSLISRFLGLNSLNFLGKASYAFYILHVPVMMSLGLVAPNLNYETKFVVLLASSAFAYKFIEDPLRRRINNQTLK